jgi:hypothetical protein
MLELGTKLYPYRGFKSISSEILNQYSYLDISITVKLKESETIYIEDDTTYFLNLGSVTIMSYSDSSSSPEKALIIPTTISQLGISERAAFHLLNHTNLPIDTKISMKNYSSSALGKLSQTEVTFKISETSFSMINVNVYREEIDYNSDKYVMYPIYLQNRDITIGRF